MPTTPPPDKNPEAAVALLKQLQLVVNSSTFADFHAIVAENEKLRSENDRLKMTREENCVLLTQKQNELNAKKEDTLRHGAELSAAREETKLVRKELEASKKEVTKLEQEAKSTGSRVTVLMKTMKDWEIKTAKYEAIATEQESLRANTDTAALKVSQELKATKKDLSSATSRLQELERYSYRFKEPKWEEITRSLQGLFGEAYGFINSYFNVDFDPQVLATPGAWSQLLKHKSILRVLPLPRSNSAPAKLMRVAAVLCVLATSLTENLFQPSYLLGESNELVELLDDLLQADPAQERHVRAQLLSFDPEQQEDNGHLRVEGVVAEVFSLVINLLLPAQQSAFRSGLEKLCESALSAWAQVQRLGPRVEPTLDGGAGDLWRLLPAAASASAAAPSRAARTDVKLVVWPAFLVARPEGTAVLSDGFVVGESQTQAAAREEVAEAAPPERHRSTRRRPRANTNGALPPGKPFLVSDSGKPSGGG